MNTNYDITMSKVKAVANSWRNRYVSVNRKVCVVKALMLNKLTQIVTVLPSLTANQIQEIWHDYISPQKGAAGAHTKKSMPQQHSEG